MRALRYVGKENKGRGIGTILGVDFLILPKQELSMHRFVGWEKVSKVILPRRQHVAVNCCLVSGLLANIDFNYTRLTVVLSLAVFCSNGALEF